MTRRGYFSAAVALLLLTSAACAGPGPVAPGAASSTPEIPLTLNRYSVVENGQIVGGAHAFAQHAIVGTGLGVQESRPADNLLYNNGQVMTFPAIGLVYWGFNRPNADPYGERPLLNDFLSHLRSSVPLNVVTQYYEIQGGRKYHIPNYPAMSIAIWQDDVDPLPSPRPGDRDIQAEALRAAARFKFGLPGVDNLIIVAVPHGVPMNYAACAYHGKADGITYTNLPYQPDFGAGCGAYSVNAGPKGILDGVTETAIHEIAESMTDPLFGGWIDAQGAEIGDKCQQYASAAAFDGKEFPVQPLWSNATGDCRY